MKKKNVFTIIRRSAVTSLLLIFLISNAYTSGGLFSGILIPATPFDYKLTQAGFFNFDEKSTQISSASFESIESLFFKARSFRYLHDAHNNQWQSPEETDIKHAGDCKDKAVWLYAQMKRHGFTNVRLVVGKYRSFDRQFHAWVLYADNSGITFLLDPTIQKRIWEEAGFSSGFYKPLYSFDGQNRYRHVVS